MSALSISRSVPGSAYRRASFIETAAVRVGSGLVAWAESRRTRPEEVVRQLEAAALRRDELNLLRADMLGAAHSGLPAPALSHLQ
ncbi:2-nitropropane dioxygenase [Arthrobacter sp. KBS0703]|uniref:2-nitropropane dioxygenase n=1 Tax=Bacteria TaxID=2 RepID=UPI00098EAAF6|nr:2-nitropropane dioxygenase [Arthrobacter sp. KBS0703]TSE15072.1 2-nitropropane dioxygenase [Arthrobacter sp. KBS0703]